MLLERLNLLDFCAYYQRELKYLEWYMYHGF